MFHPIIRNRLPNKLDRKLSIGVLRRLLRIFEFQTDLFSSRDLDYVPAGFPLLRAFATFNLELIARNEPHVVTLVREHKVGVSLLVDGPLPSHFDISLGLALLELLVVVGFQLDQRLEDLLVLLWILIPGQNLLVRLFHCCLL